MDLDKYSMTELCLLYNVISQLRIEAERNVRANATTPDYTKFQHKYYIINQAYNEISAKITKDLGLE
jgi:hypothetical protein